MAGSGGGELCRTAAVPAIRVSDAFDVGHRAAGRSCAGAAGAFGEPGRGDLVVFRRPGDEQSVFFERVVAVAGDRVKFRDKKLFVNGMEQHEPYALRKTEYVDPFRDNFPQQPSWEAMDPSWAATVRAAAGAGEVAVPEGHVFVLGDNRDNSLDSRYFGFVPLRNLVGKPRLVYFSADTDAGPALLHPSSIRWGRMFRTL